MIVNYARFYALLNRIHASDKEELKRELVRQYTEGRTESLREMTIKEYDAMCDGMRCTVNNNIARDTCREELRRKRSTVLHLMQKAGVDTSDWGKVDAYCSNSRIAGKKFSRLTTEELDMVAVKIRIIQKKGNSKHYSHLN